MQYFDKNAIFENYFLYDVYVWMFECRKISKNICENSCEMCEMCEIVWIKCKSFKYDIFHE